MKRMTLGTLSCAIIFAQGCVSTKSSTACDSAPDLADAAASYPDWQTSGDCELCSSEPCLHLQSAAAEYYPYPDASGAQGCAALNNAGDTLGHEGAKALAAKLKLSVAAGYTTLSGVDLDQVCQAVGDQTPSPPPLPTGDCPDFDPDITNTATNANDLQIDTSGLCPLLVDNNYFRFTNDDLLATPMNLVQKNLAPDVCGCWLRTDLADGVPSNMMWWSVIYSMANFKTATILSAGFCGGTVEQTITVFELKLKLTPLNQAGKVAKMLDDPNSVNPPTAVTVRPSEIRFAQGDTVYVYTVSGSTGTWGSTGAPSWVSGASSCQSWWELGTLASPTLDYLVQNDGRPVGIIDPAVDLHLTESEVIYNYAGDTSLTLELAPQGN